MKQIYFIPIRRFLVFSLLLIASASSFAQKKITGKISDSESGDALIGASVAVKGTSTGAAADANGNYTINVPNSSSVLVFSFVGYQSQEVKVGNQSVVNVSLANDAQSLEEVVVTGYAAQQKKNITGSVVVVDTKEMTKLASSNFVDQLTGKVAGVQMSTSGDPGSASFVRIRGIGTINNNEPLYVVDGVPVQNEADLNFLNPNDIESMQVLKDAASASIYGSRAANGVIVITTKKGRAGNSKLNIDVFSGLQMPGKAPELLNPTQFLEVQQKLAAGAGVPFTSNFFPKVGGQYTLPDYYVRGGLGYAAGDPAIDPSKYYLNPDPTGAGDPDFLITKTNKEGTDWFHEMFNQAPMNNIQLSASGGSEKGSFYLSGNVYDHNGILVYNRYRRYQVRANNVFNIKKRIRVGQNLNFAYQSVQGVGSARGGANDGSVVFGVYGIAPMVPVYDIMGNFAGPPSISNANNPISGQYRNATNNPGFSTRLTGNIYGEVDLIDGLTFKSSYGTDLGQGPSQTYSTRTYDATEGNRNPNGMSKSYYLNRNWVFFNTLSYQKNFGDHGVTALAGTEAKKNYYEGYSASGTKLAFGDNPNYRVLGNLDPKTFTMSSYAGEVTTLSQFVQGGYTYMDKYLVNGTVRRDGSSRFINNKYGVFPSGSVGWRISKENFMKDLTFISELKLKGSYGVLGNNEVGSDYPGFSNFGTSPGTSSYSITGAPNSNISGFDQNSNANPDLRWEKTAVTNIGFDANLLKKIDIGFEWYSRQTSDMIYPVEPPLESGYIGSQAQNIGSMSNKGVDVNVGFKGKAINNELNYTLSLTGSTYKNKVLALEANDATFIRAGGGRIGDITKTVAGYPISQFFGYQQDGLWKSQSELDASLKDAGGAKVGRFKFRDLNGDGKIDNADETYIGSPLPKFLGGLNFTASYKGFDATVFASGQYGNKIFNFAKYWTEFPAFQRNRALTFLTEAGKTLPVIDGNDNYSSQRSSYYVEDGSFIKLRNLQFGYTIPTAKFSKLGINKCRVYVQGQNLLTLTKYSGLDPEVSLGNIAEGWNARRDLTYGVDYGRLPITQSYIVGANLEF